MSRIISVIRNKDKIEKQQKKLKEDELQRLKEKTLYKASLIESFKTINAILSMSDVDSVVISVPNKNASLFSESLYSEELAMYDIRQVPNKPESFKVSFKMLY